MDFAGHLATCRVLDLARGLEFETIGINDIRAACENFAEVFLFADDGKLFKHITGSIAPCGLRGCKNIPALFPGWMSY